MEQELVNRSLHDHPEYAGDNAAVYNYLEEATRGTSYAVTLKPYQHASDGRNAYLSLIAQYAGTDKWASDLKKAQNVMNNYEWSGQSSFTLEKFLDLHKAAHATMVQCSKHVICTVRCAYNKT